MCGLVPMCIPCFQHGTVSYLYIPPLWLDSGGVRGHIGMMEGGRKGKRKGGREPWKLALEMGDPWKWVITCNQCQCSKGFES